MAIEDCQLIGRLEKVPNILLLVEEVKCICLELMESRLRKGNSRMELKDLVELESMKIQRRASSCNPLWAKEKERKEELNLN